jgi:hypothetical protein
MVSKALLLLSLIAISFLGIGAAVAANNPLFWLASSTAGIQAARVILGVILILQLSTDPPRHLWFRIVAGLLSASIGIWAIQQSYSYHMGILDSLAFVSASLSVFITALERQVTSIFSQTASE